MTRVLKYLTSICLLAQAAFAGTAIADDFIIVQSTSSTQNSGLYDALLPRFAELTDIEVRVVAVGTGQAIKNAANCDGDVLLVHAKSSEQKFIADGYGLTRSDVMYNDFVIVGPNTDPAGIVDSTDVAVAMRKIAETEAVFASRGDDSGTHKKELSLWVKADIDGPAASGSWYRETGSGMGATLNVGVGMNAYVMTDRATWIAFGNKANHKIMVEGDPALFNQYGILDINPARCPNVKTDLAAKFIDWLLSSDGQDAIATYQRDGQQLFFPNAK